MVRETGEKMRGRRIAVLHEDRLVRESLGLTLQHGGFELVGQTGDTAELREIVEKQVPDVALVSWDAVHGDTDAVRALSLNGRCCVVLVARPQGRNGLLAAVRAGATGCLSANMSADEFLASLDLACSSGVLVLSRDIADSALAGKRAMEVELNMSDREREVVGLVGQGASNREIAEALIVSEHTVKVHLRNILNKLDLRNRQQIAAFAVREGFLPRTAPEDAAGAAVVR